MFILPLAFDIASPAMLGWLAAAAAPVLIHLWSRRRHREMTWAAMEYLLAALRSSRRKIQFEQLLLLLVRMMLVMSVVTAVAEPLLERGLAVVAGQRTHRMLVIDGSFSMGYRPTDKSRFDQAKELAARIVEESPRGDGFTLVLSGAPPRTVVRTPVFEPRDFLREIENLKLPHATSDLRATLEEVERVLTDARREQPRVQRAVIYFLSDLCRVGWLPEHDSPAALAEIHRADQTAGQGGGPGGDRRRTGRRPERRGHRPAHGRAFRHGQPRAARRGRAEELRPPSAAPPEGRALGRRPPGAAAVRRPAAGRRRGGGLQRLPLRIAGRPRAGSPPRKATSSTSTTTATSRCR